MIVVVAALVVGSEQKQAKADWEANESRREGVGQKKKRMTHSTSDEKNSKGNERIKAEKC